MGDLSLRGLGKRYGKRTALHDVTLEVKDGELLVLLGPSGSGKSTLLKLVAGIERPDQGEIWLGGSRIDRRPARHRDLAMVFQSFALYPHMNVLRNLSFPLQCAGVSRKQIRQEVEEVAGMLGLRGVLRSKPDRLSGGEQQRVALGRAIVRRPQAFLFDEPLSSQDPRVRLRLRRQLAALHERLATTTIYVTHDQTEAMTLGQRMAVIDEGVVHQVGTPQEVYEAPANLLVAEFLGSPPMNLLRLEVAAEGPMMRLVGKGVDLWLPSLGVGVLRDRLPASRRVVLGVRAENLEVRPSNPGPALVARVGRVDSLGARALAHLEVGTVTLAAWVPPDAGLRRGEVVPVGLRTAGLRFFDPATGQAVA